MPIDQKKLISIVEWVRQNNPVIEHSTGFDALVDLIGLCFDEKQKKKTLEYEVV